jgi:hypothetical protein
VSGKAGQAPDRPFDVLVAYRLDRLGREAFDLLLARTTFDGLNLEVRFVKESFSEGAPGKFQWTIMSGVAEFEKSLIVERTKGGRWRRVREGNYLVTGVAPYGYRQPTKGELEPDEETAPVVRRMFEWCAYEDLGAQAIATRLTDEGVATPMATHPTRPKGRYGTWSTGTVSKILRHARYRGENSYAGIPMPCPRLVDDELWYAAQRAIERRGWMASRNTKRPALLRRVLFCRHCGSAYTCETKRRSDVTIYSCSRRRRHGKKEGHDGIPWRLRSNVIEPRIKSAVERIYNDPDHYIERIELQVAALRKEFATAPNQAEALDERASSLGAQDDRLTDGWQRGIISEQDLLARRSGLRQEIQRVQEELSAIAEDVQKAHNRTYAAEVLLEIVKTADRAAGFYDERTTERVEPSNDEWRDLITGIIDRVWIEPDGGMTLEGTAGVNAITQC